MLVINDSDLEISESESVITHCLVMSISIIS